MVASLDLPLHGKLVCTVASFLGQGAKPDKQRERRSAGAKIATFRRIFTRVRERRANLGYRDLSDRADELWFELSKGLV